MPFWSSKSKVAEVAGPTKEEQEAAKKEEEERIQEERNERLLPWNLEQKVAVVLNPVKIPFIIIAGLLGSVVEVKIGALAQDTWYRGFWGTGPECVVHRADYKKLRVSTHDNDNLNAVTSRLDELFAPVATIINSSAHKIALGGCTTVTEDNMTTTRCDMLNGPLFKLTFEADNCDVKFDAVTEQCTSENELSEILSRAEEGESVGVMNRIPYVPYALIWMIFKLVWIPGYYIDRAARLASRGGSPPEPMLKLISEPTCDKTGKCGEAGTMLSKLGVVSKVIRFSLLPNTLILPLTSMRFVTQCREDYIIYSQDASFGFTIYCWLLCDLVGMIALYAVAQTVLGGQALEKMWYRCYKTISIFPTLIAMNLFIIDIACSFKWRFWQGIRIVLQLMFTLELSFDVTLDIAKTVANAVVLFDILQFTIMIMSIFCPKLLGRAPIPEWLQEWTAQPDDIASAPTSASLASRGDETRGLLGEGTSQLETPPLSPRPASQRPADRRAKAKAKPKPKLPSWLQGKLSLPK